MRLLLPPGSESHSYEPTPQDIIAIGEADLFIYAGGESDTWVERILATFDDAPPKTFRLTDCVTLLEEQTSQSMQAEAHEHEHEEHDHEHEHDEEEAHDDHDHEEAEMDEHVWTSPKNMMRIVEVLADTLCEIAPAHEAQFSAAAESYIGELSKLDAAIEDVASNAKRDLLIFGDRFPFRYLAHDYGLRYDAAFPGCSEDSEPSVRTIVSLVDAVREQDIPVVFYIEFSSRRTADILAEETGAKERLLHSCHNVSAAEMEAGATYVSLMWANVDALKEALW